MQKKFVVINSQHNSQNLQILHENVRPNKIHLQRNCIVHLTGAN
jgi:hypothetical protein